MNGTQLLCIQLKIAASDYRLEVEFKKKRAFITVMRRNWIFVCHQQKKSVAALSTIPLIFLSPHLNVASKEWYTLIPSLALARVP